MKKYIVILFSLIFYLQNGIGQTPIATLKTTKANGDYILISFKAKSATNINIDFGNGIKEAFNIETSITPLTHAVSGAEIKIYATDPQKLIYLDCRNSNLTSLDLGGMENLEWLECQSNQISKLDISKNVNLKYLNCNNNQLSVLDISKNTHLFTIQCKGNKLTYSTLPIETPVNAFICEPQQPMAISAEYKSGLAVDLSTESIVGENSTMYTWKTKAGNVLVAENDYTIRDGKTIFLKPQVDSVYCEMTNASFPDFQNSDVLKTTNTKVTGASLSVISMTSQKAPETEFNFTLQAWDNNTTVYIDYGNGLPVAKTIHSEETPVPGTLKSTSNVKIYSAGMYYLDCSFNQISALDISKNKEIESVNCYKNQLSTLDISQNINLTGIDLGDNLFTSVDISKNTKLTWFSAYKNQLTSIDLKENAELTYLDVSYNKLSTLDVTQNSKLNSFNCANNNLTMLDVSKNTALFRLECLNNKLTFATLPIRTMQEYRYFPQQPVSIAKQYGKGDIIDLSVLKVAGSSNTVYTLKTKGGSTLTLGTQYSIDNGKITLLETQTDSIYCIMTNATFPNLKGADALVTSYTKVSEQVKQTQTISFAPLPDKKENDIPFNLNATASSGLPVAFISSDPAIASISGNTVTIHKTGNVVITATQAGNQSWEAAAVTQTLTILPLTGIENLKDDYTIGPNPVSNMLNIKMSETKNAKVSIYNSVGIKIRSEILNNGSLDVSDLKAGIYYLQLEAEGKHKEIFRFVKL
jgi:Leucine-rich repeat (LRR) protein